MRAFIYWCALFFLIHESIEAQKNAWTWTYTNVLTSRQKQQAHHTNEFVCMHQKTPPANQFIFSWNAIRPEHGYIVFKMQVRDEQTHQWYDWHRVCSWGNIPSNSYSEERNSGSSFYHVRLELPFGCYADEVRVVANAYEHASLSCLRATHMCASNLSLFESEMIDTTLFSFSSHKIAGVPRYSQMLLNHQRKEVLCSPTACGMFASYVLQKEIDAALFAENVYDHGLSSFGSWPFNVAHLFEHVQDTLYVRVQRLTSFKDLYASLRVNIPLVVSVRGSLKGAPKEYPHGHLLLVIGWNKEQQKVVCHDPACSDLENVCISYDIHSFLTAWERSKRLAYFAFPKK